MVDAQNSGKKNVKDKNTQDFKVSEIHKILLEFLI